MDTDWVWIWVQVWILRAWKTGARFDTLDWARKASFFTMVSFISLLRLASKVKWLMLIL